jgi:hypothetical protein
MLKGIHQFWKRRPAAAAGVILFAIAFALRLTLVLWQEPPEIVRYEEVNVAASFAEHGTFADAYGPNTGPSAHCLPLYPMLMSVIFKLFGMGLSGGIALAIVAAIGAALGYSLLPAFARAAGLGVSRGLAVGMAGAVVPVSFWAQTNGLYGTSWTFAVAIILGILLCRVTTEGLFQAREAAVVGLVTGIGALLNSCFLTLAAAVALVTLIMRRQAWLRVVAFFAVAGLCTLLVLSPWAIRNRLVLGTWIFTRSNLGLELQVSNNDVCSADGERNVRSAAAVAFHPYFTPSERERIRQMGAVAYDAAKKHEAIEWIHQHPRRFLILTAERIRLLVFPAMKRVWQTAAAGALSILAFCGLIATIKRGNQCGPILAAMVVGYLAIFLVVQVLSRYRFPIEGILLVLASALIPGRWVNRWEPEGTVPGPAGS